MPPRERPRLPTAAPAFTLIELLVSMTVLTLLIVFVGQLVSSATMITTGGRKRLDADSQARVVFDRMALDIANMLKRPDVDYLFAKISGDNGGGNDKMFFYSESPAFYDLPLDATKPDPTSSVSLIGYRINAGYQLERLGRVLTWDGAAASPAPGGIIFLSPSAPTGSVTSFAPDMSSTLAGNWKNTLGSSSDSPPYTNTPDEDDYHLLADGVFRLEFCFQLTDGTFSTCTATNPAGVKNNLQGSGAPAATDGSNNGYAPGSRWFDTTSGRGYICVNSSPGAAVWSFLGMQDVKAIVVAMGILDATSNKSVPTSSVTISGKSVQAPNLKLLVSALTDAVVPSAAPGDLTVPNLAATSNTFPRLMAEAWSNELKTSNFAASAGIPQTVAGQIRIYQRSFVLNTK